MKSNATAVSANLPGNGQAGLKSLRLPIQADQYAAREIANGLGSILFHEQGIESFLFAAETEVEFAAGLDSRFGASEDRPAQNEEKSEHTGNAAHYCATSCNGRPSRKHMTTIPTRTRGPSLQGLAESG